MSTTIVNTEEISNSPDTTAWLNRPLKSQYVFVFLESIFYTIVAGKQPQREKTYILHGIDADGYRDILGVWDIACENRMSWLGILKDLKNRGIQSVYLFRIDCPRGFALAASAQYPQTHILQTPLYQARVSTDLVLAENRTILQEELKKVYMAADETEALSALAEIRMKWGSQYSRCFRNWLDHWNQVSPNFDYPKKIRDIIYAPDIKRIWEFCVRTRQIISLHRSVLKLWNRHYMKFQEKFASNGYQIGRLWRSG